jgi:hypothetical protein
MIILKSLILANNDKLPSYEQLGMEGYDALCTIMHHFNVDEFNDIVPYIIESIHSIDFFDSDVILYQIDRNITFDSIVWLYNHEINKFDKTIPNVKISHNIGYYQFYGGIDIYDRKSRHSYYWPFLPNRNLEVAKSLLIDLCLPIENPFKDHFKYCDKETFMDIISK